MKHCRNKACLRVLAAVALTLTGCGKDIPKDILQPDRMENVLYDYHLSSSMSNNLNYTDNYQKEAYKAYVFDKHHITEAEFDSSMVWYTRHTERLALIYKRLGERFRNEKMYTEKRLAEREKRPTISLPGDTVDIWHDRQLYWLTKAPLTDRIVFEIPADSNFKAKDAFVWAADYRFLSDRGQKVLMGFNVQYDNDSVVGCVKEIMVSGLQTLSISPDSAYGVKQLNGFICYTEADDTDAQGVIVDRVTLTRYHALTDIGSPVSSSSDGLVESDEPAPAQQPSADNPEVAPLKQNEEATPDRPVRTNPRKIRDKK